MILIKESDILHKIQLQKLLISVIDDQYISQHVCFKGGTCAEMLGFLDRFSVDLDFDIVDQIDDKLFRKHIDKITRKLGLVDDNKNTNSLFFNFKYNAPVNQRNKIKFSFYQNIVASNNYKAMFLPEINRLVKCQTIETMFANKLVTVIDRYNRHKDIEARDLYDINYFFLSGFNFKQEIIKERTGLDTQEYFKKLIDFIDKKVSQKMIDQDLNMLLPLEKFNKIRKTLKQDTLLYLRNLI
jgi:predicted nucleotidyltransferase component of viral defense system